MKELLKAVGTGPKGSRGLTASEAFEACQLILSGVASASQIGGLLLAIRTKGETAPEMEGFLLSLKHFCRVPFQEKPIHALDIGCPYDGHVRQPGLWLPAAIVASAAGQPIVLHGFLDLPAKFGVGLIPLWNNLGRPLSQPADARTDLEKIGIVCLSQDAILPELSRLSPLRGELGLRTLFNTVEKALNPLNATHMAIGYYHETILTAMEHMVTAAHPDASVTFVGGQEGSVGLFNHRPTRIFRTKCSPALKGESLPAPPEKTETIAVEATPEAHGHYVRELLSNAAHPHRKALIWQASTLLVLGGTSPDMKSAQERLMEFQEKTRW